MLDPYPCPPPISVLLALTARGHFASHSIAAPVMGSDGNLHGVTTYSNNQQYGAAIRCRPMVARRHSTNCLFQPNLVLTRNEAPVCAPKATMPRF
jgi:hypothetical protein